MTLPKIIKIGGFSVRVSRVSAQTLGGEQVLGDCNTLKGRIRIKKGLRQDQAGETLVHELVHYLDDILDLNLSHTQTQALGVLLHHMLSYNDFGFLSKP